MAWSCISTCRTNHRTTTHHHQTTTNHRHEKMQRRVSSPISTDFKCAFLTFGHYNLFVQLHYLLSSSSFWMSRSTACKKNWCFHLFFPPASHLSLLFADVRTFANVAKCANYCPCGNHLFCTGNRYMGGIHPWFGPVALVWISAGRIPPIWELVAHFFYGRIPATWHLVHSYTRFKCQVCHNGWSYFSVSAEPTLDLCEKVNGPPATLKLG